MRFRGTVCAWGRVPKFIMGEALFDKPWHERTSRSRHDFASSWRSGFRRILDEAISRPRHSREWRVRPNGWPKHPGCSAVASCLNLSCGNWRMASAMGPLRYALPRERPLRPAMSCFSCVDQRRCWSRWNAPLSTWRCGCRALPQRPPLWWPSWTAPVWPWPIRVKPLQACGCWRNMPCAVVVV